MSVSLKTITISNFKSFGRQITISFIEPFTAITGPNGSGKSNIMDAIRFVLGEKLSSLRVKCLSELIYGASIGEPTKKSAYVTVIFQLNDDVSDYKEKSFTRIIHNEGSQYKIDDKIVNGKIYMSELEEFSLDIKAGNFLMPQNHVEYFAMKTSKEQIEFFEQICGSNKYRADYDRLKLKLLEAGEEINFVYKKKRQIQMQKRHAMAEKVEAEKYLQQQEQYMKEKLKFRLVQLLLIKKIIESLQYEEKKIKLRMDENQHDKKLAIGELKDSQFKSLSNSVEAIEQSILEMEGITNEKKKKKITFEESILYWQKKRDCARISQESASKAHETKRKIIQELKDELEQISKKLAEFSNMSQKSAVELDDIQVKRYMDLKNKAEFQTQNFAKQINNLMQDYQADYNKLEHRNRRKQELEDKMKQKIMIKKDLETRLKKLQDLNAEYKATLMEKTIKRQKLNDKIIDRNNKALDLEKNIASISEELQQANMDNYTVSQQAGKIKTVQILKQLFSGVYDRLFNLCKPIHPRYNVAVTKAFSQNMNAIVVDTMYTVRQCIKVLKQQQIGIEIFLALDSIKTEPLKEHLRAIKEPKNVKLLYDVLNISSSQINTAVLFVAKNTLVCETAKDARIMAYEIDKYNKYDCVSLDGCFYHKSGIMSGGKVDLVVKAKQWEQISALVEQKAQLMQAFKDLPKISLLQSELDIINIEINELGLRNKYIEEEIKDIRNQIVGIDNDLSMLGEKLSASSAILSSLRCNIEEKSEQIKDIEKYVNIIKNEIFIDFCKDINVPNISYYEENDLWIYQEQKKRQMDLEQQYDRIRNQLNFENERDTENKIWRWERAIKVADVELNKAYMEEHSAKIAIEQEEAKMSELKNSYTNMKEKLEKVKTELSYKRSQIGAFATLYLENQKAFIAIQREINKKKTECDIILKTCKIEDITIPILSEESYPRLRSSSISMSSSDLDTESSSDSYMFARIDFSQFPEDICDCSKEELENIVKQYDEKLPKMQKELEAIANPNLKAKRNVDSIAQQLLETNTELQKLRKKHNERKTQFETTKTNRHKLFSDCLEHVTVEVDSIHKKLVNNTLAQAFILSDNPEEPYAGNLIYNCMVPLKIFQPIQYLSGGERSLASLALLFAFQRYKSTPFFIMDEVDAGLDNANINTLARFIRSREVTTQFIAITLRKEFYSRSNALVGVITEPKAQCTSSKVFAISLREYKTKD